MKRELQTVQTQQNLNKVYAVGVIGPGGANHFYHIEQQIINENMPVPPASWDINFQLGPRKESGSVEGITDQDLLEIVKDRLTGFQSGEYACGYNAQALFHVEEALKWLNRRVEDRINRNVLGTYKK